jgi:transposase InsO family protein
MPQPRRSSVYKSRQSKIGNKLLSLCTDSGGEFLAGHFKDYCAELGIRRERTTPYSPQKNGVIKWRN